ncbi:FAD-binding and (Fe-S)-binding domain-containing protein [Glaciimonas sp. PCH181]|uniref:FAD-binding and (Fe-S)-binding domain-containing protein n=1 Tax=Glaciimonas sp. PCH181 TaxID=2133943 RepID=UPI000D3B60BD|nr:FAD-binding and (Fe-S)-binding domain-containing protein [Glaciimonas sp. PCH181]PUA17702.1 FAD-binding oxidoreductase [Glaciimonas sp. PCH181]
MTSPSAIDINRLLKLQDRLKRSTTAEVRFDAGTRAVYASEASNYRQIPIGVVIPRSIDDFVQTVAECAAADLPILARGAGTSMCGQSVNAAVIIDHSKYLTNIIDIDPIRRVAKVEPGVICDQLNHAAAKLGLTFGPDPASHSRCTIGGMIGNNSCGAHSVMAGKTVENIERLEILTYDGERFWVGPTDDDTYAEHLQAGGRRAQIVAALKTLSEKYADDIRQGFPQIKRRVSGYNLDQLLPENGFNIARALVGVEGSCVSVLQAETLLVSNPAARTLVVFGFSDIYFAADAVPQLLPFNPIAMEGLDEGIIGGLRDRGLRLADIAELPKGQAWLMVEFGGTSVENAQQAAEAAAQIASQLQGDATARVVLDKALMRRIWTIRETGASATSLADNAADTDPVVGWEDAAVEPALLGAYLREFSALVARYGYKTNLYGHFGDGCVHSRITFDLKSDLGVAIWRNFLEEAAHLVVKYGGSLSGEHGDGQAKGEFLNIMYSPAVMAAFADFKNIWDPKNKMNPGKLIHAMPVDSNLRLGPDYERRNILTEFNYNGDAVTGFARATERCIGMGKCRSLEGGTMCPSFKATREEKYSTRGRARLFFELLKGEVIQDSWDSKDVKDSLDLCLSCKGCKTDCPTNVDIARYKAEFLAQHYRNRRRPVMDLMIGRIGDWLPRAQSFSALMNLAMSIRPLRLIAQYSVGLTSNIVFPRIARKNFRSGKTAVRLQQDNGGDTHARSVLLWTDTFNSGFTPAVLEAATAVLERADYKVHLLSRQICCGRPYYDAGMLDRARTNLHAIIAQLSPYLAKKIPVIVLEPSCLSVFRDEMVAMLPGNDEAKQLSTSVQTLAEFLFMHGVDIPKTKNPIRVHGHCHQKACGGMTAEKTLLASAQTDASILETGCCGMAGAYGYHEKTAAVARRIGELELKPQIDRCADDTLFIADGFSCRSQIKNLSNKKAYHFAEWLNDAQR